VEQACCLLELVHLYGLEPAQGLRGLQVPRQRGHRAQAPAVLHRGLLPEHQLDEAPGHGAGRGAPVALLLPGGLREAPGRPGPLRDLQLPGGAGVAPGEAARPAHQPVPQRLRRGHPAALPPGVRRALADGERPGGLGAPAVPRLAPALHPQPGVGADRVVVGALRGRPAPAGGQPTLGRAPLRRHELRRPAQQGHDVHVLLGHDGLHCLPTSPVYHSWEVVLGSLLGKSVSIRNDDENPL